MAQHILSDPQGQVPEGNSIRGCVESEDQMGGDEPGWEGVRDGSRVLLKNRTPASSSSTQVHSVA